MAKTKTYSSDSSEMLTTTGAANMLGVSPKTIYRMESSGFIESVRTPGGQRRFRLKDLESYLDRSKSFVAPQNPSKYKLTPPDESPKLKEDAQDYLFDIPDTSGKLPSPYQIKQIEEQIKATKPSNHRQYYDTEANIERWIREWDFKAYNTKTYTHGFHTYPAMFIPQVARKLIKAFSNDNDTICDIFCGSGTTLVESSLLNRNSIGIELNPLAVLISRVKTTPIDPGTLMDKLKLIVRDYEEIRSPEIPNFPNINYWFSENVIEDIARLRQAIWNIFEENVRNFFCVCFSEVVRVVSFTRHGEFKLYRDKKKMEGDFSPDVMGEFIKRCHSNILGMREYLSDLNGNTNVKVILGDSSKDNGIPAESIDLIITSPPYGDSRTTVAYGQFSRLSSQWLNLLPPHIKDLDNELLGGKNNVTLDDPFTKTSQTLEQTIKVIAERDAERAKEVLSFYIGLYSVMQQAYKILKPQKYFCLVVGNRTVKNLVLKTDQIICEVGENLGFNTQAILYRNIPNKRMPL
ncbi:helix-turn-helix domain-containing protein, partial [Candidatus Poribacteria bacterium]|nr:helix-turn-helix domain-containing protein [Candidatus Poribacteria bacterium]